MDKEITIKLFNGIQHIINLDEEDLSWEIVETDEREMGVERLHEAVVEKEFDEQDTPTVIYLRVWEYPEGIVNMQEIEVEGGELVKECDLGQFVISYYDEN